MEKTQFKASVSSRLFDVPDFDFVIDGDQS